MLAALPEGCVVYHEAAMPGCPAFLVLLPTLGIIAIEVKGWHADEISGGDERELHLSLRTRGACGLPHPSQEAWGYLQELLEAADRHPWADCLHVKEGRRAGSLVCPVNALVAMPHLSETHLALNRGALARLFPRQETLVKEDLETWEALAAQAADDGGQALLEALASRLELWWDFPTLDSRQMTALRVLTRPEIKLPSEEEAGPLRALTLDQEDKVLNQGEGISPSHRVVHGGPGSGKTSLLAAHARRLRRQSAAARLLVLCHNRALGSALRDELAGSGVDVRTFHSWAWRNGIKFAPDDPDDLVGEELLRLLEQGRGEQGSYDAVLVDEGQDFEPDWLRCALLALKNPEHGEILVAVDGTQCLHPRRGFDWADVGLQVPGGVQIPHRLLERNFRNPAAVDALARSFSNDGEPIPPPRIPLPSMLTLPTLCLAGNRDDEESLILHTVRTWLEGHEDSRQPHEAPLQAEEIGILYPSCHRLDWWRMERLAQRFEASGIPLQWVTPPRHHHPQANRPHMPEGGVRLQSIESSRGLEYRAVIVMWLDLLPDWHCSRGGESELADRRLLHIALTRTTERLCLTTSQRSRFVREVEAHPCVQVVEPAASYRPGRADAAPGLVALPA